jgi:hypothetical protein
MFNSFGRAKYKVAVVVGHSNFTQKKESWMAILKELE